MARALTATRTHSAASPVPLRSRGLSTLANVSGPHLKDVLVDIKIWNVEGYPGVAGVVNVNCLLALAVAQPVDPICKVVHDVNAPDICVASSMLQVVAIQLCEVDVKVLLVPLHDSVAKGVSVGTGLRACVHLVWLYICHPVKHGRKAFADSGGVQYVNVGLRPHPWVVPVSVQPRRSVEVIVVERGVDEGHARRGHARPGRRRVVRGRVRRGTAEDDHGLVPASEASLLHGPQQHRQRLPVPRVRVDDELDLRLRPGRRRARRRRRGRRRRRPEVQDRREVRHPRRRQLLRRRELLRGELRDLQRRHLQGRAQRDEPRGGQGLEQQRPRAPAAAGPVLVIGGLPDVRLVLLLLLG
mmetsp:Transcript_77678/g.227786  ORF Transcript_77678/g.227786 Transcript_77678/m.227786 type:complete len:356 (-) Transcript_77678:57-1124(-)